MHSRTIKFLTFYFKLTLNYVLIVSLLHGLLGAVPSFHPRTRPLGFLRLRVLVLDYAETSVSSFAGSLSVVRCVFCDDSNGWR